ncbi:MAG: hypothetical protein MK135_09495 [Polyangiaceae bacterium]|nr:hypothetical protein [Polyangiaceae bacterium]
MMYRITFLFLALLLSFACTPAPPASQVAPPALRVENPQKIGLGLLQSIARRGQMNGAGELIVLNAAALGSGESIDALLGIPDQSCALLYARASEEVEDLDLLVFADDGSILATDEAPDETPTLVYCPREERRIFIAARVIRGDGLVALGAQPFAPKDKRALQKKLGARDAHGAHRDEEEPWPGFSQALSRRQRLLGGHWKSQRNVILPLDARLPTKVSAVVPAERCLDMLTLPSADVGALELVARDRQGRRFAESKHFGAERAMVICAAKEEELITIEIRPHLGRGLALLSLNQTREEEDRQTLSKNTTVNWLATGQSSPQAPLTKRLSLEAGIVSSIELKHRGCGFLKLRPSSKLEGWSLRIWSDTGQLIRRVESIEEQEIFVCQKKPSRVDIYALTRAGVMSYEFKKVPLNKNLSKALLKAPDAAAEIASIFPSSKSWQKKLQSSTVSLSLLSLDAQHISRTSVSVPAQTCLREIWAISAAPAQAKQSPSSGIQLRAIDSATGYVAASARGQNSLEWRSCSKDATTELVLEAFLDQGAASILRYRILEDIGE